MKGFRYYESVATLKLDRDKCVGCTLCTQVCPHQVFDIKDRKAHIIDFNACMECGACVTNCPADALSVTPGVG